MSQKLLKKIEVNKSKANITGRVKGFFANISKKGKQFSEKNLEIQKEDTKTKRELRDGKELSPDEKKLVAATREWLEKLKDPNYYPFSDSPQTRAYIKDLERIGNISWKQMHELIGPGPRF